ncbi:MAG: ankyrin repeat domain-containing protein [Alphaproteobacteria bacterium]
MLLSDLADRIFKPTLDEGAFFRALGNRDAKYVARTLKHFPAVSNKINAEGRSPLNIAVDTHNLELCKLLIDAGANLDYMDPKMNMQPLNRALHTAYADIAGLLIDKGADVNARDGNGRSSGSNYPGQTPLYMAVSECPVAILKKLVAKGAKVNDICDDNTPLTLAAMANNENDNAENIKYLLSAGADIGIGKPSNGVTADQLAYKGNMKKHLEDTKKKYDIDEAARQKARSDMEAIRAKELASLQEKQAVADGIAQLTEGTRDVIKVNRPLRLKLPSQ